jgi:hypothetical protein
VTKRSDADVAAWRDQAGLVCQGEGIPKPCMTFEEASMPQYVLDEVIKCGFPAPSPIQSQGWPMALLGRDMVGISKTGSGKVKKCRDSYFFCTRAAVLQGRWRIFWRRADENVSNDIRYPPGFCRCDVLTINALF